MSQQHVITCEHCLRRTDMQRDPLNRVQWWAPQGWVAEGRRDFCSRDCRERVRLDTVNDSSAPPGASLG